MEKNVFFADVINNDKHDLKLIDHYRSISLTLSILILLDSEDMGN